MSEDTSRPRHVRVWKSAKTMSLLVLTSAVVTCLAWYFKAGAVYWPWYATGVVSAAVLIALYRRPQMSEAACTTLFLVVIGWAMFANTWTNFQLAQAGAAFEVFGAYKLVAIAVAVIAPTPVWVGFTVIGTCLLVPVLFYFLLFAPETRALFAAQEPWMSVIYAVVAFFVLRHRLRGIEKELRATRINAEQRAVDDLARIFLGLRDLTNTPLQSIELTANLLGKGQLTVEEASQHLERSLVQLRELSQILNAYESRIDWTQAASSFSAVQLLQQKLAELQASH